MPARQQGQQRSLRQEVAVRRGDTAETDQFQADLALIEKRVQAARKWWGTVAPSHIDPDQFVQLCLGMIRQGQFRLRQAIVQSPETFMQAVAECARDGLIPGETYYFVPFKSFKLSQQAGHDVYEVTGITAWQGEVDMIFRAGGVASVHVQEVRANDTFIWRRGTMELPHHVIHGPEASPQQEGLADDEERGVLTGVYAYARMTAGGYSEPVIMSRATVKKHYDVAKTHDFWGEWDKIVTGVEAPWTVDMFKKTALHKLYDLVPHSSEYMAERLRMVAAMERAGVTAAPPPAPAIEQSPEPPVAGNGHRELPESPPPPPSAPQATVAGDKARAAAFGQINGIFAQCGLAGDAHEGTRRAVLTAMVTDHPEDYADLSKMATADIAAAASALEQWVTEADAGDQPVLEQLVALAGRVRAAVEQGGAR